MKIHHIIFVVILIAAASLSGCRKDNPQVVNPGPEHFLRDDVFDRLEIELLYVNGYRPKEAAIDSLHAFLKELLHKPAGIDFILREISSPGKSDYTLEDVQQVEKEHRLHTQPYDNTLTAVMLFLDGDYAGNDNNGQVLGIAYGSTSIVVFEKTVHRHSGTVLQPSRKTLEAAIMQHEFGHILGLVDAGTPMVENHRDEAHGKHCSDEDCLMYYLAETNNIAANLLGGSIPKLDAYCRADLKANGGK